jgi:hypothetical protein
MISLLPLEKKRFDVVEEEKKRNNQVASAR